MKFTKGKWNRLGWLIVDKNEVLIADCRPKKPASVFESYTTSMDTPIEEITANAQLIASAPLLYVALKGIEGLMQAGFAEYNDFEEASEAPFKKLHEALAKAEK